MGGVAYNPNDPLQQGFLAALAQGETGGYSDASTVGVGGQDLSSLIMQGYTDQYGFPLWNGQGNSHAAGTFQFQPSTWDSIASEYHLDFTNPDNQAQGAWYLAEQTDPNLYSDLQSGNYSAVQAALAKIWPSVTGNGAAPQGLAANIARNVGLNGTASADQTAANNASGGTAASDSSGGSSSGFNLFNPGTWAGAIVGTFAQGALVVIGAVIIFVALWMLLSSQGVVPSPKETVKGALKFGEA
jgi:muramidase (phage lysozyme)